MLGVGIEGLALEEETASVNPAFSTIQLRAGLIINRYFSIQGQTSIEVAAYEYEDSFDIYETDDYSLESAYGVFAVPRLPLGDTVALYGRIGYVNTELDVGGFKSEGDGPGYGGGIEFDFSNGMTLGIDYTYYDLEFDIGVPPPVDITGGSFATTLQYRF